MGAKCLATVVLDNQDRALRLSSVKFLAFVNSSWADDKAKFHGLLLIPQ